jgi:hypothetical protein
MNAQPRYELPEDRQMWDIWLSMHHLPAMAIADELGVFQALEHAPATSTQIAQHLGFNVRATGILTSMLTALGLLIPSDGRLALADVTRTYLLPKSPYYWGPLLRTLGVLPLQRGALTRALQTPENGAAMTSWNLPSKAWESGQMSREQAESVSRVMHCHSLSAAVGAARNGGFEKVRRLLDVGGGSGCFSIALAQHHPLIRCSVMDLPVVCDVAQGYIDAAGVSDRVDTAAIDMFRQEWPRGFDGVFFSNVFHDWSAQTNLVLAQRAFDALPSGGRVFLHEMLLEEDGSGPLATASFSVLMMFGTQGRQYASSELRQILTTAGFADCSVCATHGYYSIVGARKP